MLRTFHIRLGFEVGWRVLVNLKPGLTPFGQIAIEGLLIPLLHFRERFVLEVYPLSKYQVYPANMKRRVILVSTIL